MGAQPDLYALQPSDTEPIAPAVPPQPAGSETTVAAPPDAAHEPRSAPARVRMLEVTDLQKHYPIEKGLLR